MTDPCVDHDSAVGEKLTIVVTGKEKEPFLLLCSDAGQPTTQQHSRLANGDMVTVHVPDKLVEDHGLSSNSFEAIYQAVVRELGEITDQTLCVPGQKAPIPLQEFAGAVLEVQEVVV